MCPLALRAPKPPLRRGLLPLLHPAQARPLLLANMSPGTCDRAHTCGACVASPGVPSQGYDGHVQLWACA